MPITTNTGIRLIRVNGVSYYIDYSAIANTPDLTTDTEPTAGSEHFITSGAVASSLADLQENLAGIADRLADLQESMADIADRLADLESGEVVPSTTESVSGEKLSLSGSQVAASNNKLSLTGSEFTVSGEKLSII